MPKATRTTKVWLSLNEPVMNGAKDLVAQWGQEQPLFIPGAEVNNYSSLCDLITSAVRTYLESGVDIAVEPTDTAPSTTLTLPAITALCWQSAIKSGRAQSYSDLVNRAITRVLQWEAYRASLYQRLNWELDNLSESEWSGLLTSRTIVPVIRKRSECN
ncbi:MAG: hypothetical protein DDT26_01847 [Dehalococcoidia bacterium]|nr:hypothetical protein [Chloroflexota bacterium]